MIPKHFPRRAEGPEHHRDAPARFEALEPRLLLAGDVSAVVVGGNLLITGDGAANEIVIDQDGLAANEFRLRSGADATTVNGEDEVIVGGVTGDVRANLRGGDDVLEIVDAVVGGDLLVHGRRGDDTVAVSGCDVGGKIVVREGEGAGVVDLTGSEAGGDVHLFAGGGGVTATVSQLRTGGDFGFCGGGGEDSLDVNEMEVGRSFRSNTGAGNDTVTLDEVYVHGTSLLTMGSGEDYLEFESNVDGWPYSTDWRWWHGCDFIGKVWIAAGAGADTVVACYYDGDVAGFNKGVVINGGTGQDVLKWGIDALGSRRNRNVEEVQGEVILH